MAKSLCGWFYDSHYSTCMRRICDMPKVADKGKVEDVELEGIRSAAVSSVSCCLQGLAWPRLTVIRIAFCRWLAGACMSEPTFFRIEFHGRRRKVAMSTQPTCPRLPGADEVHDGIRRSSADGDHLGMVSLCIGHCRSSMGKIASVRLHYTRHLGDCYYRLYALIS